ncbi:putative pyrroloquinoline-quinone-binding quinoprotein [Micromonospora kangleipakensis]|uniref:Putative pyrroloquinoline-quinone-binding quinoprotein n=1 Tax=Micromonospora kangleipakensis TaxID=1077942 RepID=A0A4Q8BDR8_9ACTN|nr:PQQ-binding-like beta-propeller repeat protein [Micromonospora kangleipakensis]RZU76054.1 putative pyrroloquinoline-quinone-binding quinoprotein [Micromonospora kangleipakensis]
MSHPQGHLQSGEIAIIGRRSLLASAAALGGAAALGSASGASAAPDSAEAAGTGVADGGAGTPLSFAVVTDTHATSPDTTRTELLRRIFAAIEKATPDFVLNCGDITEYGGDDEFQTYLSVIPPALRPRLRHVPGNHEARWDVHAKELYHRLFGPTPYSFDVAGLHVVGLDPTQVLQEPGVFGRDHLRWLANDLRQAGQQPSLLFLHYPIGGANYYVNDQDELLDLLADFPVRAIFAGHVHTERVDRINQLTQVAAYATKDAYYYWVRREVVDRLPVLRVWQVTVAPDGSEQRREVTTIPVADAGVGVAAAATVVGQPKGAAIAVRVRPGQPDAVAAVQTRIYPQHVYGGRDTSAWTDLPRVGDQWWDGNVDISAVPPGAHRLQVRVTGSDGSWHEVTRAFEIAPGDQDPRERWGLRLTGSVQGALAAYGDLIVAGSTGGDVEAFRVGRPADADEQAFRNHPAPRTAWRTRLGGTYRGSAFTGDGRTVLIGSTDHHLYALDTRDGAPRWRHRTEEPVLSNPLVAIIGGVETVLFTAGFTLYALEAATGRVRWTADLHGFFAGRVACDGERVYAGSGDGKAYAFDAATGHELWSYATNTRTTPYQRLIYGPWDNVVTLLPGGLVLVSTVSNAHALDRATGAQRWRVSGGFAYAPPVVTASGLVLIDEFGRARRVDPLTGAQAWLTQLGLRVFNAGPVVRGNTIWVPTATGQLVGLALASGEVTHRVALTTANTFSTPVVVDDLLVSGDQSGVVRGIALP